MIPARIGIVTAGHLATCPRMVKAADALSAAGYDVHVVSASFSDWAADGDADLRRGRDWGWTQVEHRRASAPWRYLYTGARRRAARAVAGLVGPGRVPVGIAARGIGRVHPELTRAAIRCRADLYYSGGGAMAAVARAARVHGVPYGLDLEDFHGAEHADLGSGRFHNGLYARIERGVLSSAAFVTTGSEPIAEAYRDAHGLDCVTVNNTFPLPATPPDLAPSPGGVLRLYWFSQYVGPGRGLGDATRALVRAGVPGELHLRGTPQPGYLEHLAAIARESGDRVRVIGHPPASPETMVDLCRGYDVGLGLEQDHIHNRLLCLSNKVLTYPLAGLATVLTDTPGQRPVGEDLGVGALLVPVGDVEAFAQGLARWGNEPEALAAAKAASWEAAQRRWHWDHPSERGALLDTVRGAL